MKFFERLDIPSMDNDGLNDAIRNHAKRTTKTGQNFNAELRYETKTMRYLKSTQNARNQRGSVSKRPLCDVCSPLPLSSAE